ncbi:hypothetical protein [Tenacibaculum aestuariivivum]|uniref:hypothetical protein n=1 Tax=Tenacibaculum aestuariivivum TaxID=2006131 RepID=UPI003AB665FC
MKKIILAIVVLASISFISCSDNDNVNPCEKCENIKKASKNTIDTDEAESYVEICSNEDATVTITEYSNGKEVSSTIKNISKGTNIDCTNYNNTLEIIEIIKIKQ